MSKRDEPRRLRAVDELDRLQAIIEALITRTSEPTVSVEHTLNAKGDTQTSVKVSAPMNCDLGELEAFAADVESVAAHVYDQATGRYPRPPVDTSAETAKADKKKAAAIAANVARAGK